MKVLIGCEEPGKVRNAFLTCGHDALSCDLFPSRSPGPHYTGDIFDIINYPWDMAIFFPPCTHTAVSGAKHFAEKWNDGRQAAGVSFFFKLLKESAHIPKTAFEQPVSIISSLYREPDQTIQPWQFGHGETKATCLWLKGLPMLKATNIAEGREARVHKMPPSENRARDRAETYDGIAEAMALQWGNMQPSLGLEVA